MRQTAKPVLRLAAPTWPSSNSTDQQALCLPSNSGLAIINCSSSHSEYTHALVRHPIRSPTENLTTVRLALARLLRRNGSLADPGESTHSIGPNSDSTCPDRRFPGFGSARDCSFHLRWLDGLGLPHRVDSLAGHA